MTVKQILIFWGTNELILGIASICGIIGFLLTVVISIRTAQISKVLKYNETTSQYNKERKAFQNTFEGHRISITEDSLKSDKLLKDILKNAEEYRIKFHDIFSLKDRIILFMFTRMLKKESKYVNYNSVCNYLAMLSGRLSKKEEKKNV